VKFTSTLELHGKTATGIVVPPEVVEALGGGKRPAVTVSFRGHSFRTTIASMGGQFMVGVAAEHRAASGVAARDVLDAEITLDIAPRQVAVPRDLGPSMRRGTGGPSTSSRTRTARSGSARSRRRRQPPLASDASPRPSTRHGSDFPNRPGSTHLG
jgi:hypothetical protein